MLNLSIICKRVASCTHRPHYSAEESPALTDGNLGGSQDRSARLEVKKSLLLLSKNETWFLAVPFRSLTSALIVISLPDRDKCKQRLNLKSCNSLFLS